MFALCSTAILIGSPSVGSIAAELDSPDCHGNGGLRRVDHRDPERLFERLTMARHPGATHYYCLRTVLIPQAPPDFDHAPERLFAARRLRDRHFERALASEAVGEPYLKQIALVPGD
jgi:hypothetical protein